MKIVFFGSGGIGGYFGARLAAAGEDVHFIARGRHLAAMKSNGLRVNSPLGDVHLETPQATDDPAQCGPA
ncbi:MAG TPA: 2-dehydropantoate 2-reductase, partial [Rhodospirillales bacterium]|nr:2-dehydropantoate 2-reductase [Rhodospirillales bacterium]